MKRSNTIHKTKIFAITALLIIIVFIFSFPSILSSVEAQTIISGHRPDGIVYKQDEKIFIVQHTGYSMLEGVEGMFRADSIIYGDIINLSDDTVYYIIMRGNVYKDGQLWEKTGYGQKWTFRYDYPVQAGNPTELAISPFKLTLRPGEASPFSLWPGQTGWDCYEVWVESYELENKAADITEARMRNDVVIQSGELDKRGTFRGKIFNPTEKNIDGVFVILLKYDSDDKIFGTIGDSVGQLGPNKAKSFEISVYVSGYPIKTHTDNLLYGKPHRIEVIGSGYSLYAGEGDYYEKHPTQLMAESQYYPNEPRPQYMNLEEIKKKAVEESEKSPVTDFCTTPKDKEEIIISSSISVPSWIKQNAGWWANGEIEDNAFLTGIGYLIQQKIIKLNMPETSEEEKRYQSSTVKSDARDIPIWIKNNAKWWSENKISTEDFVSGIKYLVEQGIIKV